MRYQRSRYRRILGLLLCALGGCNSPLIRSQSPEVEPPAASLASDETETEVIGDVASATGLHFLKVEGVGLVNGLADTGSDPQPSALRDILLSDIRAHSVTGATHLVASPTNALVTVTAYLPPGVRKNDVVDVEVRVPRGSKTSSLDGGYLLEVRLQEMRLLANRVRTGNISALAAGDVVVDAVFDGRDDSVNLLRGRVMGGARSLIDRPIHLVLHDDQRSVRMSQRVGKAINARFHMYDRGNRRGVAKPLNDRLIELSVPPRYRGNVRRYIHVIRRIALRETPAQRLERIDLLSRKLLEPTTAARAAAELEAIGDEAIGALRAGLASTDDEVRFYAAEALAYLDVPEACDTLADVAEQESAFRWYALAALTAMREVAASEALASLLHSPSAETRYGAFRALRTRNMRDPLVTPERRWGQTEYHSVPTPGAPMIHFARSRHQEIVLFGQDIPIRPPAVLFAGKRILIKGQADGQVKLTRFAPGEGGDTHRTVPPKLDAVIRAAGDFGATYGELLQMIRQARSNGDIDVKVVVDALARPGRRYYRDKKEGSRRTDSRRPEMFADRLSEPTTSARPARRESLNMDQEAPEEASSGWSRLLPW